MIHVPKSAGTSIASTLYGRSLGHFSYSEFCRNIGVFRHFSPDLFAIIREPEDRFLSAYRFFKQGQTRDAAMRLSSPRSDGWKQDLDSFLTDYLEATPDHHRDYVFQSQGRFVFSPCDNSPPITLFRFEEMASVEQWLSKKLEANIVFPLKNQTENQHTVELTADQRSRIRNIYKDDLELYEQL